MAISADQAWAKQADEAIARRARENREWPEAINQCINCGEVFLTPIKCWICYDCVIL